jgi:hypothetical protein
MPIIWTKKLPDGGAQELFKGSLGNVLNEYDSNGDLISTQFVSCITDIEYAVGDTSMKL